MRKLSGALVLCAVSLMQFSCGGNLAGPENQTDEQIDMELDRELAAVMEVYSKAIADPGPDDGERFREVLRRFDEKYGSDLAADFGEKLHADLAKRTLSGGDYPPLGDLPFQNDGDIYISGGRTDAVGSIIEWVAPNVTAGRYAHGACFDLDKFDPTNLESACFHTAVEKGAGYESAMDWMTKANVAVLRYTGALDGATLNGAQASMDTYCNPANTNMQYGFFKNYADIFSIVTKADNYYWYCSKMVWRIFSAMGIDLDSNTPQLNWKTSGLYNIVVAYYNVKYWYSRSKANAAISQYINNARSTLVLPEEMYFSPLVSRRYEVIRN